MDFDKSPVISSKLIGDIQSLKAVSDLDFDQIYPPRMRAISDIHWSSVKVAQLIAEMLKSSTQARFMDIGSGVGKLCTLLSFLTDWEIYGVEQREDLYKISQTVAEANSLDRVHFVQGNMLDLNWSEYNFFYLYNPFQEHKTVRDSEAGLIDKNILLDQKYHDHYVSEVYQQMKRLQPGKKIITYQGYGHSMPPSFRLLRSHYVGEGHLSLWEKQSGG